MVAMAWCVGYGRVAVSDAFVMPAPKVSLTGGRGRGLGREKSRELRSRWEVGERDWRLRAILAMRQPRVGVQWRPKWCHWWLRANVELDLR